MILIDSSAWIEFLRDTGSPTCERVTGLLDGDIAICEPIVMEILAGARDDGHLRSLRSLLGLARVIGTESMDFEMAAMLYRSCRRGGATPRKMVDCLIAAIAIRSGTPILHADRDFDLLAQHTKLAIA